MDENEIAEVLLFGNKIFSEDMNFRIIISSIPFIKETFKDLMNYFLLERNLLIYFHENKNLP